MQHCLHTFLSDTLRSFLISVLAALTGWRSWDTFMVVSECVPSSLTQLRARGARLYGRWASAWRLPAEHLGPSVGDTSSIKQQRCRVAVVGLQAQSVRASTASLHFPPSSPRKKLTMPLFSPALFQTRARRGEQ